MKKIGIVGGVAWPSTVEYYAQLCRRSEQRHRAAGLAGTASIPEISIESLDMRKALMHIGRDEDEASWSQFDEYHRSALQRLEASGAELALMASNTVHHRFAAIMRGVGIPVIDIIEVVARECARIHARRVLLLGTGLTMRSPAFVRGFAAQDVEAAGPQSQKMRAATVELIAQLQRGELTGAAERIGDIARTSLRKRSRARAIVCLACTELPLAFPAHGALPTFDFDGISYVNSAALHVDAAFDLACRGFGGESRATAGAPCAPP